MAPPKLLALGAFLVVPAVSACASHPPPQPSPPATAATAAPESVGVTELQGEAKPQGGLRGELARIDDALDDIALRLQFAQEAARADLQQQVVDLKLRDLELREQLQATQGSAADATNAQRVNRQVERGIMVLDRDMKKLERAINPNAQP
jgi:hypothetical protein